MLIKRVQCKQQERTMNITHDNWKLVDKDGNIVHRGYKGTTHRGEEYVITGGRPPTHLGSTGRVA